MAWLGALYILIALGLVFGIPAYIGYRRRPAVLRNKRRRQIEQALHLHEVDRDLVNEVAEQWGYDPRRYPNNRTRRGL